MRRFWRREYARPRAKLDKEIGVTEERLGKKGLFQSVVRKLTGAEKRDQASLSSLKTSLQGIETRMGERRDEVKQGYARDWEKMERRHAAERIRDERLIERRRSEGSRARADEVARKSFRVRARSDTAVVSQFEIKSVRCSAQVNQMVTLTARECADVRQFLP